MNERIKRRKQCGRKCKLPVSSIPQWFQRLLSSGPLYIVIVLLRVRGGDCRWANLQKVLIHIGLGSIQVLTQFRLKL